MEQKSPIENKELIAALRKADRTTIIGEAIQSSLDKGHDIILILSMIIDQLKDDESNNIKIMPEVLGEGYEFITNWFKSYKLL